MTLQLLNKSGLKKKKHSRILFKLGPQGDQSLFNAITEFQIDWNILRPPVLASTQKDFVQLWTFFNNILK